MIFVTLGTQDKSFERLLSRIEKLKKDKIIKEKVIVQAGFTKFSSNYLEIFDYIPIDKFNEYIDSASLIITHGGAGSILTALRKGKKVIAVPRLSKYKEHTNDHQLQIVEELDKEGYLIKCSDIDKLDESIYKIKSFKPKTFNGNNSLMLAKIDEFINKTNNNNHSFLVLSLLLLLLIIILVIFSICL